MKLHIKMLIKSFEIVALTILAIIMVFMMILVSAAYGQHRVEVNMERIERIEQVIKL